MTRDDVAIWRDYIAPTRRKGGVEGKVLLEGFANALDALEEAWHRIDEVERQNLDLTVERDSLRDQLSGYWRVAACGTDRANLWVSCTELIEVGLKQRVQELQRGEYICKKCSLRKDGEPVTTDF